MKKNSILFVHPISQFSGSLKSLEEYLKLLQDKYNLYFLTPSGISAKRLRKYGDVTSVYGLSKFDNSKIGYYRGLRWFLIFRELFLLLPTIISIYNLKKKKNFDIIHFNEITLIPTIYIFKFFFKVPFVLHCRILFKSDNFFGKKIIDYLKLNINQIIAIDKDVKDSLTKKLNVSIVRNILTNIPKKHAQIRVKKKYIRIGYLGSFLKYKGIEDLVDVVESLVSEKYYIKLYLAGNFIKNNFIFNFFNLSNNINTNLIKSKNIILLGHLNNLDKFYGKIDILCFPSYLNALGRQVIEAGFYKIPSIVCLDKNNSDSFINKKTGLSFTKAGDLTELKKKITYFYLNRSEIYRMGKNAHKLMISNFNNKNNYDKLENIYKFLLN